MSKTQLKKYTKELTKDQLEEQILLLYDKFPSVKTYYDFVFQPNERKLANDARVKIAQEYFPNSAKRPKLRRSIAQKILKHFISLGVDPFVIADLMLFAIEIAQSYTADKPSKQDAFTKACCWQRNKQLHLSTNKEFCTNIKYDCLRFVGNRPSKTGQTIIVLKR